MGDSLKTICRMTPGTTIKRTAQINYSSCFDERVQKIILEANRKRNKTRMYRFCGWLKNNAKRCAKLYIVALWTFRRTWYNSHAKRPDFNAFHFQGRLWELKKRCLSLMTFFREEVLQGRSPVVSPDLQNMNPFRGVTVRWELFWHPLRGGDPFISYKEGNSLVHVAASEEGVTLRLTPLKWEGLSIASSPTPQTSL